MERNESEMSATCQISTATSTWTIGTITEPLTVIADGRCWPVHAMPATCSNGTRGYLLRSVPRMWRDGSPFGKRECYIVLRSNGSVVARSVALTEALANAEGRL